MLARSLEQTRGVVDKLRLYYSAVLHPLRPRKHVTKALRESVRSEVQQALAARRPSGLRRHGLAFPGCK